MFNFSSQFTDYKMEAFKKGVRFPEIPILKEQYEVLGLKDHGNRIEYLKKLTWTKFQEKFNKGMIKQSKDVCVDRLKFEFEVFEKTGTIEYILLLLDILGWCDVNDIPRGTARGSAAGSFSLYCLGLIGVNALDFDLNFTRFLSEVRVKPKIIDGILYADGKSCADFDCDISNKKRPLLLERIKKDYAGKTAHISTVQYLTGKMALKETLKTYSAYNEEDAKFWSDKIDVLFGKVDSIPDSYKKNEELKKFFDNNKDIYEIAGLLEGLFVTEGIHASGVLISHGPILDLIPLQLSVEGDIVSGFSMDYVLKVITKIDLLGLKSVDQYHNICNRLNIKPEDIDVNDPRIYQFYQLNENFHGLFQIEAGLTKEAVLKIKPKNIDQLAACLSISRPGALKHIDAFAKYVNTGEMVKIYPQIDFILGKTGNILLYQEQIISICQNVYKMSAAHSDEVRHCITKDTYFISKTRGYISIEELLGTGYKDDLFLIMDENGKQSWKKVKEIWSNGTKTAKYVEASNGMYVRSTRWHQFLTSEGWKAKNHLIKEDYLVCAKSIEYDGKDSISPNLSIIIAGLLTEGYFNQKSRASFTNWDKEIMDKFVSAFSSEFGENKLGFSEGYRVAYVRAMEVVELRKYMSLGKSRGKMIPKEMMGMTYETTAAFLGYMFDCEATVTEQELSFTSASKKMSQQIQLLLLRFGIRSNFYSKFNYKYKRDYYYVDIGIHKDVKRFNDTLGQYLTSAKRNIVKKYAERDVAKNSTTEIVPNSILRKFSHQYSYLFNYGGGNLYTGNISFDKFKSFAQESNDKHWINFSNGKHEYSKLQNADLLYDREAEVFDFSMEDEDCPYIIANGMVIHNCIGKKKPDEIKKWEPILFEQGKKYNIPETVTKWFWDTCNASADYLFNASHCYSYGYITAYLTYLKATGLLDFYLVSAEMANDESDSQERLRLLQKEMKEDGVDLLPPDLTKSNIEFSIENHGIRFGLGMLRGISEKNIEKLQAFKSSTFSDKFQLFENLNNAGLNIGIGSSLIQAGCLEAFGDRTRLVLELQAWNILNAKEKTLCLSLGKKFNFNLLDVIDYLRKNNNEKGKLYILEKRFETFKKKFTPYREIYDLNRLNKRLANYWYERKILGYSFSESLRDIYDSKVDNILDVKMATKIGADTRVKIIGFAKDLYSSKTKKGNNCLSFVIYDETGELKIKLFNDSIEQIKIMNNREIEEEDMVIVEGRRKDGDTVFGYEVGIQSKKIFMKLSELSKKKEEVEI